MAITIDDGPEPEVTGRVLDVLDEHGARATFFCIGERVERHPALARSIVARGHEIGNHSYRHRMSFSLLGPRGIACEVVRAQQAIGAVTGGAAGFAGAGVAAVATATVDLAAFGVGAGGMADRTVASSIAM